MRNLTEFENHPWPFGKQIAPDKGPSFRAVVHHIVDGDTFDAIIDLGFKNFTYQTIRLRDVDAPEIFHPKSTAELALGKQAASFASLLQDKAVVLVTEKDSETFGRFVAYVYYIDINGEWTSFGQSLIDNHLTKSDVVP